MVSSAAMMAFFEESEGHLDIAEASLLELEKDHSNSETLNELFRAIHSLKGNAGLVGFTDIHEVATEMETLLDQLRKGSSVMEQNDLDVLFGLLDKLQNLVEQAGEAAEAVPGKKTDAVQEAPSEPVAQEMSSEDPPSQEMAETPVDQSDSPAPKPETGSDEGAPSDATLSAPEVKPEAPSGTPSGVPVIDDEEVEEEMLSFLTFALGKETYGIDIKSVREIILSKQLTRVPNAKEFVTGIMNLRGMVIPAIDAKKRLGFSSSNEGNDQENMNIIIVEEEGLRTGIRVDMVEDIVKFSKDMIVMSAQVLGGSESSFVYGMGKTDDKTIVLLDIKTFCGVDEHYY